jgi:hypothetical protein
VNGLCVIVASVNCLLIAYRSMAQRTDRTRDIVSERSSGYAVAEGRRGLLIRGLVSVRRDWSAG